MVVGIWQLGGGRSLSPAALRKAKSHCWLLLEQFYPF